MVSQPTMRFIFAPRTCLAGLTAILLLFAACGQNEGGRCQINSDCASGLTCRSDTSGNGVCSNPNAAAVVVDAAFQSDLPKDETLPFNSDVGAEALPAPEMDAESVDTGAID
jgi:hypothetical protein